MVIRATVTLLLLLSTVALPAQSVHALTISDPLHFRVNRGPNPVGLLVGDSVAVGAQSIVPAGSPTTATATQDSTTRNLVFAPFSISPNLYTSVAPFNPALVGSWTITATNGVETATELTPPIPNPKTIPLVTGLQIAGTGPTPLLQWTLPNLAGLSVDQILVRVWDLDHPLALGVSDILFQSQALNPNSTSFLMPGGVLQVGTHYSFALILDDLDSATGFGSFASNRSETFTDPFEPALEPVPEPATLLLLGSTFAGAGLAQWRQRRRQQS